MSSCSADSTTLLAGRTVGVGNRDAVASMLAKLKFDDGSRGHQVGVFFLVTPTIIVERCWSIGKNPAFVKWDKKAWVEEINTAATLAIAKAKAQVAQPFERRVEDVVIISVVVDFVDKVDHWQIEATNTGNTRNGVFNRLVVESECKYRQVWLTKEEALRIKGAPDVKELYSGIPLERKIIAPYFGNPQVIVDHLHCDPTSSIYEYSLGVRADLHCDPPIFRFDSVLGVDRSVQVVLSPCSDTP